MRARQLIVSTLTVALMGAPMSTASAATINGTSGPDTLNGTAGNDTINGKGGADELVGKPGSDYLFGNTGDDRLYGGKGADKLYGGMGLDLLDGGNDGQVKDRLYGENGPDQIYGRYVDLIAAGDGNDHIVVHHPNAAMHIYCGAGIDRVLFASPDPGVGLHSCEHVSLMTT